MGQVPPRRGRRPIRIIGRGGIRNHPRLSEEAYKTDNVWIDWDEVDYRGCLKGTLIAVGVIVGAFILLGLAVRVLMAEDDDEEAAPAAFSWRPTAVDVGPDGVVWVTDAANDRVFRITAHGPDTTPTADLLPGPLPRPLGVAVIDETSVLISSGDELLVFIASGAAADTGWLDTLFELDLRQPEDLVIGPGGTLYVGDRNNARVVAVAPDGSVTTIDTERDTGLAVGPGGDLFVAETDGNRVVVHRTDGTSDVVAGTGDAGYSPDGTNASAAQLDAPHDVAVAADGTIYIADTGNHAIRSVGADGVLRTVAGVGDPLLEAEGGSALETYLGAPVRLAIGPRGTLFVVNRADATVRAIERDGSIHIVMGTAPDRSPDLDWFDR